MNGTTCTQNNKPSTKRLKIMLSKKTRVIKSRAVTNLVQGLVNTSKDGAWCQSDSECLNILPHSSLSPTTYKKKLLLTSIRTLCQHLLPHTIIRLFITKTIGTATAGTVSETEGIKVCFIQRKQGQIHFLGHIANTVYSCSILFCRPKVLIWKNKRKGNYSQHVVISILKNN